MSHRSSLPLPAENVVDLLQSWADDRGSDVLYRFLSRDSDFALSGSGQGEVLSYAVMDRAARRVGGWLQQRTKVGDRVLVAFPSGLEYLTAFYGCLYAGVIAVPAYAPAAGSIAGKPRTERLQAIIADAGIELALTTTELAAAICQRNEPIAGLAGSAWHAVGAVPDSAVEVWRRPQIQPSTIAFLQYTSGSTGVPKGVTVTHRNLLHNQELVQASFRTEAGMTLAGWLPLHHDMGLIGNAMHPLAMGGQLVFLAPIDFLQRPIRWLQAVSKFSATVSGGPNFAYKLCVDEISDEDLATEPTLDLSGWRVAFNGAEPVDAEVMRRFADRFASVGFASHQFCPCYGMAETTLLVTSKEPEEPLQFQSRVIALEQSDVTSESDSYLESSAARPWVACGSPHASLELRIVDPLTLIEQPMGQEGEIWVAGDTVTLGYWNRPEETTATFAARIDGGEQTYLRTGDLGFLKACERGGSARPQLYITGRRKDLIIVHGVNHYPQDIERTVEQAHPSLAPSGAVAFAVEGSDGDEIVVVAEVRRTERRDLAADEVVDSVANAIAEDHQLATAAIVLIRPGGIPKTTSGKVQRRESRRKFLNNEFRELHRWSRPVDPDPISANADDGDEKPRVELNVDREEIRRWLITHVAERLGLPAASIEVNQPLARYGFNSVAAVRLAAGLSERLGRDVPATLAYEFPTIAKLADHLSGVTSSMAGLSAAAKGESKTSNQPDEPIAVVGIACRFPGASTPSAFWELIRSAGVAIGKPPANFDHRGFKYEPGDVDRAGYLDVVDQFDAGFFGIHAREADLIDPQQRLLLELTWESLADAGVAPDRLMGQSVGVFMGVANADYARLAMNQAATSATGDGGYIATGNSMAMASNRVSYTFDFCGPSLTVDTACSSSLVATHQAMQSLRNDECDWALAGGANLILSADTTRTLAAAGMLSTTGDCRPFADGANGFVRGEGGGVVVLRRLSEAIASGNRIYAVLAGSAVNQDGRTNGLTAPNRRAQTSLIRQALRRAGWRPEDVDLIEAHGTSTPLGDPIEMQAITEALRPDSDQSNPLVVGSVKANIGHLEGAAGIAGLIRVVLAMHHGQTPPQASFVNPSEQIAWHSNIRVPTQLSSTSPRRAGVSSFGFGGTNAHVLVEAAPPVLAYPIDATSFRRDSAAVLCSAKTPRSLLNQINQLAAVADQHDWASVTATLASGRSHARVRAARWDGRFLAAEDAASVGDEPENAPELDRVTATLRRAGWKVSVVDKPPQIDWYFSGQGGCFRGAGQELVRSHAAFRDHFEQLAQWHHDVTSRDLGEILWGDDRHWVTAAIQPALFALQMAVAQMWQSLGVRPTRVVGHSLGEYAAACTAGVFSIQDGLRMVAARAELMERLIVARATDSSRGGMMAVFADEATVRDLLSGSAGSDEELRWEIAAMNSDRQTVVSARQVVLPRLAEHLKTRGITTRAMQTSQGFHSWMVEPILDDYAATIKDIAMTPPSVTLVSSQTGRVETDAVARPSYWVGNLRSPVRFLDAMRSLASDSAYEAIADSGASFRSRLGMEIGAGSTLASLVRSSKLGIDVLPGLAVGDRSLPAMAENLGQLYLRGVDLDWTRSIGFHAPTVSLPTTAFERRRHWIGQYRSLTSRQSAATVNSMIATRVETDHSVLELPGERLDLAADAVVFQTRWDASGYLADHRVGAAVVFPAAGYLAWARSAVAVLLESNESTSLAELDIVNLRIVRPLTLTAQQTVTCQLVLSPLADSDHWRGRVVSRQPDGWVEHAHFELTPMPPVTTEQDFDWASRFEQVGTPIPLDEHYAQMRAAGIDYGPSFRGITRLTSLGVIGRGHVELPAGLIADAEGLHPAVLDAAFQVVAVTDSMGRPHRWAGRTWVPVTIEHCRTERRDTVESEPDTERGVGWSVEATLRVKEPPPSEDEAVADVTITRHDGRVRVTVSGLHLRATAPLALDHTLFEEAWQPRLRRSEPISVSANRVANASNRDASLIALRDTKLDALTSQRILAIDAALEWVAQRGAIDVLNRLGVRGPYASNGSADRLNELADRCGVVAGHRRLLRRLLELASLASDADSTRDHAATSAVMTGDVPEARLELALLARCVAGLPEVLRGGGDPLPLLFPVDGQVSAADVYRDSLGGKWLNELAADAVAQIADHLPPGRGLRILEIGAGTGATTAAVLPRLPMNRCEYVFTDISPAFLKSARERFEAYEFVDYRTLDIERDPAQQGFAGEEHHFDLIIAANVLHATADMTAVMKNVSQLLHRSGRVVIAEGVRPAGWLDLTFGLTPGWWRAADQLRSDGYPLLSTDGWRSLLAEFGFDQPLFLDPVAHAGETASSPSSVIVADRKPGKSSQLPNDSTAPRRWCLIGDHRSAGVVGLTEQLRSRGQSHIVACQPAELSAMLAGSVPTDVVLLASSLEGESGISLSSEGCVAEWIGETTKRLLATTQALLASLGDRSLRLWWLSPEPSLLSEPVCAARRLAYATGLGLLRTLMLEQPNWRCTGVTTPEEWTRSTWVDAIADEVTGGWDASSHVDEVSLRGDVRHVRRLVEADRWTRSSLQRNETLMVRQRGSLRGVRLTTESRREPGPGEVEIEIEASGLNFRDVMNALGHYPGQPLLGAECAGRISRVGGSLNGRAASVRPCLNVGTRVIAVTTGCLARFVVVPVDSVAVLPNGVAMDAAVTLPVAYLTASHALRRIAELRRGQTVLIHAGAGGVGLAAIQIAQRVGATVITTASAGKHTLLRQRGVEHVFDSRRPGFGAAVHAVTDGRGVDVVLNSLGPAMLPDNLSALADGGLLVDIALADPQVAAQVQRSDRQLRYHWFDLSQELAAEGSTVGAQLDEMLAEVSTGCFEPLPARVVPLEDAVDAMRELRDGRSVGKLVLDCRDRSQPKVNESSPSAWPLDQSGVTVVAGGLGGLGQVLVPWLVQHGARDVVVLSRRSPSADAHTVLQSLRQSGCRVEVVAVDISDAAAVDAAMASIRKREGRSIRSVWHLAGTLDDAPIDQQTPERLARVLAPKVAGAWNLHRATLNDPLDHFVMFSSFSGWLGSPGQSNHAMANAFLDGLATERRRQGLPAVSIGWGPWSRIGAAKDRDQIGRGSLAGIGRLEPIEGLTLTERLMESVGRLPASVAAVRLHVDQFSAALRQRSLLTSLEAESKTAQIDQVSCDWRQQLQSSAAPERFTLVADHIRSLLRSSLALPPSSEVGLDQPLFDLGLDSLTSLELVNSLAASLHVSISTVDLFNHPNVRSLTKHVLGLLQTADTDLPLDSPSVSPAESAVLGEDLVLGDREGLESTPPANLSVNVGFAVQSEVAELLAEIGDLSDHLSHWGSER